MSRLYFSKNNLTSYIRGFAFACLMLTQSACGFIVESISDLTQAPKGPSLLNVPISPVYLTALDSYLKAEGGCQGYAVIEFTYSSALTSEKTVFGKCVNDLVTADLPVSQGDQSQTFNVKIVGYLAEPTTTSPLPPNLVVQYTPPIKLLGGFAVTSGGGTLSGATATISNSSVGEVVTGTQSSAGITSKNGLQGALDQ